MAQEEHKYDNSDQDEAAMRQQSKSWAELQQSKYSEEADKIANNKWMQLRCKTNTLRYDVTWVNCIYIMIAVICIPIGVITYILSQSVVIQEFPAYHSLSQCALSNDDPSQEWGKECKINYTIEYDFDPPIYVHYKLTNFYQNHRSYVKSMSKNQLNNEDILNVNDCDPADVQWNDKLFMLPCGLIANSFFNDKIKATYYGQNEGEIIPFCNDTVQCQMDEQFNNTQWTDAAWFSSPNWENFDISWKSDSEKFEETQQIYGTTTNKNERQIWQNVTLPNTNDKDFIVWMRTSTISTFYKLYRIINGQSLKKGDVLELTIKNYFDVSSYDGQKSIVITTNSSLGGRNDVLGIAFMSIGSLALFVAVCFRLLIPPKSSGIRPIQNELETATVMDYQNGNMK